MARAKATRPLLPRTKLGGQEVRTLDGPKPPETRMRAQRLLAKVRKRSVVEHDFPQLVTSAGMHPEIKENPPLIYHWREQDHAEFTANVQQAFARYRETLQEDRRLLLDRFQLLDIAIKVVGVGSVGTWCAVALLMASELSQIQGFTGPSSSFQQIRLSVACQFFLLAPVTFASSLLSAQALGCFSISWRDRADSDPPRDDSGGEEGP
jgi:hypothetical protein